MDAGGEEYILDKCEQRQNTDAIKPVVEIALNSFLNCIRRLEED